MQNAKTWNNYVDRLKNPVDNSVIESPNQSSGQIGRSTTKMSEETSLAIKEEKLDDDMVSEYTSFS